MLTKSGDRHRFWATTAWSLKNGKIIGIIYQSTRTSRITASASTSRNSDQFPSTPTLNPQVQLHEKKEILVSVQLFDDKEHSKRPEIRNTQNSENWIKDAIATVSYRAAISIPKAKEAVQTTCETFYNHQYYLNPDERKKFEPLEVIEEADKKVNLTNESNNSFDTYSEPPSKIARSKDIENYKYVLPSR